MVGLAEEILEFTQKGENIEIQFPSMSKVWLKIGPISQNGWVLKWENLANARPSPLEQEFDDIEQQVEILMEV